MRHDRVWFTTGRAIIVNADALGLVVYRQVYNSGSGLRNNQASAKLMAHMFHHSKHELVHIGYQNIAIIITSSW